MANSKVLKLLSKNAKSMLVESNFFECNVDVSAQLNLVSITLNQSEQF
jgi:hypothetical protein